MQDANPTFMCINKMVNDSFGLISSHAEADVEPYSTNVDCLFTIKATPGSRINLRFEFFDLEQNYDMDTGMCKEGGDRFEIYESGNTFWIKSDDCPPERVICGGTGEFPEDYQSVGGVVTVRFITDGTSTDNKGLQFLYSSFIPAEEETEDCFVCKDGSMCLDNSLKCDGVTQCNDDSDELKTTCSKFNMWHDLVEEYGFTMVVVVASALALTVVLRCLVCICCCCCCCCCRKQGDVQEQKSFQSTNMTNMAPRPTPPATAPYHTHNSNPSNYSSYSSMSGRPQPNYPSYNQGNQQNGHAGYQPVYNPANSYNGRAGHPQKV
ncbi:hypothetical protein BSL78_01100 [Apostichopus japonicus]|uniref:CUB domain-containing protein n=1 Tax=Stichopus japonicus TaxID=307972 RepID=A0A2G8LNZ2_STIJA|nr:hypothetical protein BSL78_01100 [Apostichopus japonicus]